MIDYSKLITDSTTLESERLILRSFTLDDADDVLLYASDDIVTKYLTWFSIKDKSDALKVIEEFYLDMLGVYAIELKEERKCIGCIDLRIFPEHEKASFGYVLNRQYWNKNYMTEALNIILTLCLSKLKLNRVEAIHYVGNEGSGRVMKKCGMKCEGTFLQEQKIKGVFQDIVHYYILRSDWMKKQLS